MGTIANNDNLFGTARFIVNPTAGLGNFTTVQAAITAASAGDTVFIMPAQYTENITLKNGVNLAGYNIFGGSGSRTQIIGKLIDGGGVVNCTLTNLALGTNSDFCIALTGSGTVSLSNCRFNGNDNTILSLAGSANLAMYSCSLNLLTTGIAIFVNTGTGSFLFRQCSGDNSGGSVTASTSTGAVGIHSSTFAYPIATSGAGTVNIFNSFIDNEAINTASLTTAGTGSSQISNSNIRSGTASAISIGSGTTVAVYKSTIDSTNTNPVTGAGTYKSDETTYSNTGILPNPTTETFATVGRKGTFTPVLQFGGGSTGITYTTQLGTFTRIGNVVTFQTNITLSAKGSSTGAAAITGLPYASAGITPCAIAASVLTYAGQVAAVIGTGGTQLNLRSFATTAGSVDLTDTAFANTTFIQVSGSYLV